MSGQTLLAIFLLPLLLSQLCQAAPLPSMPPFSPALKEAAAAEAADCPPLIVCGGARALLLAPETPGGCPFRLCLVLDDASSISMSTCPTVDAAINCNSTPKRNQETATMHDKLPRGISWTDPETCPPPNCSQSRHSSCPPVTTCSPTETLVEGIDVATGCATGRCVLFITAAATEAPNRSTDSDSAGLLTTPERVSGQQEYSTTSEPSLSELTLLPEYSLSKTTPREYSSSERETTATIEYSSSETTAPPEYSSSETTSPPDYSLSETTAPIEYSSSETTAPPESSETTPPPDYSLSETTAHIEYSSYETTSPPEYSSSETTSPPEYSSSETTSPPEYSSSETTSPPEFSSSETTAWPESKSS